MTKKVLSLTLVLLIAVSVFCGCNSSAEKKGEEATLKSDADSVDIKEDILFADEQLSNAAAAKATATPDAFRALFSNPDINLVSFNGTGDITVEEEEFINKTLAIKTTGAVSINSPVSGIVLINASKGVMMNAKADSIIVEGESITCDLSSETGDVHIIGKNCVINVRDGNISKIIVRNSTALINNHSNSDIEVTLANGVKVAVEKGKTYDVKDNLIREAE